MGMFSKRTDLPEIERAVAHGVSYELTLADQMRRSERRAWRVAACAVAMSLVLAGGYVLFLPLKERVPYMVMADPYTGTASVARLSGNFHERDVTMEEAVNKSNAVIPSFGPKRVLRVRGREMARIMRCL